MYGREIYFDRQRTFDHVRNCDSPGDFEDSEETNAAENRDAKRRHKLQLHEYGLHNTSTNHKTVEAVEERHKVRLKSQTVHLNQHLACKQG